MDSTLQKLESLATSIGIDGWITEVFIIVFAMVFGFRSSVTNFTCFSVLFQSDEGC